MVQSVFKRSTGWTHKILWILDEIMIIFAVFSDFIGFFDIFYIEHWIFVCRGHIGALQTVMEMVLIAYNQSRSQKFYDPLKYKRSGQNCLNFCTNRFCLMPQAYCKQQIVFQCLNV